MAATRTGAEAAAGGARRALLAATSSVGSTLLPLVVGLSWGSAAAAARRVAAALLLAMRHRSICDAKACSSPSSALSRAACSCSDLIAAPTICDRWWQ